MQKKMCGTFKQIALTSNNVVVTINSKWRYRHGKISDIEFKSKPYFKTGCRISSWKTWYSYVYCMFLNQIVLVGGIPFSVTLPNAPESIDMTKMNEDQIHAKIQRGYESYKAGHTQNAAEAFNRFRESHS